MKKLLQGRRVASFAVAAIGFLVLAGWVWDVAALQRGVAASSSANPLDALMLMTAALGLTLRRAALPCAALVVAGSVAMLANLLRGWGIPLDCLLFGGVPDRMSPLTAFDLGLAGLAIALLRSPWRHAAMLAQAAALAVLASAAVVVVGYLHGVSSLAGMPSYQPMSAFTALGLLGQAVSVLLAAPQRGLMARAAGRVVMRATILAPVALDVLSHAGTSAGLLDAEGGDAMSILSRAVLMATLVWWTIQALARTDRGPAVPPDAMPNLSFVAMPEQKAANDTAGDAAYEAKLARMTRHLALARNEAEQASRAKIRFLANVNHELRTPLNGILGYGQLLRMGGKLDPTQAEWVDAMLDAGRHLLTMVNEMLDLSQIEANEVVLTAAGTDLLALARACLDTIRPAARAKGLDLAMHAPVGPHYHAELDAGRLRQMLLTLLGHAVAASDTGTVSLAIAPTAAPGWRIEVTGTGAGLADATLGSLIERFESPAAPGGVADAGLGLAVASRLVRLMGGQFGCARNTAGGMTFSLDVPSSPVAAPVQRLLRVLVVDDVAMNRDLAAALLRAAGHSVTCVDGGAAAVAAVEAGGLDVVLMDVRMPGVDGLEATRRIRGLNTPAALVPIVAVTAQAFADQVERCRQAGMDSHVAKPFDHVILLRAVEQAAGPEALAA